MDLPPPWELRESKKYSGRCYYYNKDTKESTWIRPIPYPGQNNKKDWPPAVYVLEILIKHTQVKNRTCFRGQVTRSMSEAEQLFKQITNDIFEQKITFEDAAKQYSDADSAKNGGIVGWIKKDSKDKLYTETAWQLRIGEMKPVPQSDDGFYLILRRC